MAAIEDAMPLSFYIDPLGEIEFRLQAKIFFDFKFISILVHMPEVTP